MTSEPHAQLQIRLLGEFSLNVDGQPRQSFDNTRLQSLLAYLALHAGESLRRSRIAYTLWPDSEEKQALTNFRNLLHKLRQALPEIDGVLKTDSQTILWKSDAPYTLDVEEFDQALTTEANSQENSESRVHLETAAALYKGDLLPSCYEEWIETDRERLRVKSSQAISKLIGILKENGDHKNAIRHSKILIQRDDLNESSHYALIELHALNGDRSSAILAYKRCTAVLKEELDIDPGTELQHLYRRILDCAFESNAPYSKNNHTKISEQIQPQQPTEHPDPKKQELSKLGPIAAFAAILTIVLFFLFNQNEPLPPLEKSIAILPFENRSHVSEDAFFTDGIHDDLITRISLIEGVKIISRTSVMKYRDSDKNLKDIARELGVATIIEGGVQRSGEQIRINVQLIDASSGFHVWAHNYTREISAKNIFALQSEITESIANELSSQFQSNQENDPNKIPTDNLAALEGYFRGNAKNSLTSSEGFSQAISYYKEAIRIDPNFAAAHAALASVYLDQIHYSGLPLEQQISKAKPHIARALDLDSQLSDGYAALGLMHRYNHQISEASRAYQKAIDLNPNNATAHHLFAISKLWDLGDAQAALTLSQKAVELDPQEYGGRALLAQTLTALSRNEEAISMLNSILEEDPQNILALTNLAHVHRFGLYHFDEAIRLYRKAFELDPTNSALSSDISFSYFNLGDIEAFLEWSERDIAIAPGSNKATFVKGIAHEYRGETLQAVASFAALKRTDMYFDWSVYKLACSALTDGRPDIALDQYLLSYPGISDPDYEITQKNFVQLADLIYLLYASGEKDRARAIAERVLEIAPAFSRWGTSGYQSWDAHIYIALEDKDAALAALREFVEGGGVHALLSTDLYTQEIHDEPEFKRLIGIAQKRLDTQMENLKRLEANGELAAMPALKLSLGH